MTSTHIRIPVDVKARLDSLIHEGESIGTIIGKLIDHYENNIKVNDNVNIKVNTIPSYVNKELNDVLTTLIQRVEDISMRVKILETTSKINCGGSDITDPIVKVKEEGFPNASAHEIGISNVYSGDEIREVIGDAEIYQKINNETIVDVTKEQVAQLIQAMNYTSPCQLPNETIATQDAVEDLTINSVLILNHEEWLRQVEVAKMMPESINFFTRKKKVSNAVKNGELLTNGKNGKECLIRKKSVMEWMKFHNYPIKNEKNLDE